MKILFVTENFFPYIHGGAEVSVMELAKALIARNNSVEILTPNYGTMKEETYEGIKIHRFPFYKKLHNYTDQLTPAYFFNPFYWLRELFEILIIVLREKIDIIHCQSLYSLPAAVIAGKLLSKPTVITFRDNQLLCNYGYCLTKNQFGKTCGWKEFLTEDFVHYYRDKVENKNFIAYITQLLLAINGRSRNYILKYLAKSVSERIVSSASQQKTFAVNKIKTNAVYNIFPFPEKFHRDSWPIPQILYATKLSPGKGLDVLLVSLAEVIKIFPHLNLLVIGSGDKQKYRNLVSKLGISKSVEFQSGTDPEKVMEIRRKSLIEVTPSVYPESFGRTALEALASGVPVVASNRGGLAEIVDDGITGYVVEPNTDDLAEAIIKAIKNNSILRKNIERSYTKLREKFYLEPVNNYLELYSKLVK